jgi:large subunit ribosomal protein L29
MKADKIRQLEGADLAKQVKDAREQMFRIRFQMTMGQVDGLKKYRELKKDRARILTIEREAQLASEKAAGKKG